MRQLSLTAMMLLVSAPAISAEYYHARRATYACVDPRATLALNDPAWHHAAWRSTARRQGHCLRVRPRENWEQVSQPAHFLRLLRQTPPRPGQPPLYFKSSSVEPVLPHDADRRGRWHHSAQPIHPVAQKSATATPNIATNSARLQITAPSAASPEVIVPSPAAPVAAPAVPVPQAVRQIMAPLPPTTQTARPEGLLHRIAPFLVWALIIVSASLLVRLVTRRPRFQVSAAAAPEPWEPLPADTGNSLLDCKKRCVAGLRLAGWDARSRFRSDVRGADVIASNGSRVLAVQCHPSMEPVDAGDVEQACQARAFQGSDLAAIVSNTSFTESARRLAARTGIVLLHEHQLASFAA